MTDANTPDDLVRLTNGTSTVNVDTATADRLLEDGWRKATPTTKKAAGRRTAADSE